MVENHGLRTPINNRPILKNDKHRMAEFFGICYRVGFSHYNFHQPSYKIFEKKEIEYTKVS